MLEPDYQHNLLVHYLKDADAVEFIELLGGISQVWDDVVDDDGGDALTRRELHGAFNDALLRVPRNRFYLAFLDDLAPALSFAACNWKVANGLETAGGSENIALAYGLRSAITQLAVYCGALLHGHEYAEVEGWAFYAAAMADDNFAAYRREHGSGE